MSQHYDPAAPDITPRIAAELIAHEGVVCEAYLDSVGVWTWSVGLTDASGHRVGRYRDNPQPLSHCLAVFIWALRRNYLPAVLAAFGTYQPQEHELAAALSFHWNTGGIARAEWMKLAMASDRVRARTAMLNWARPVSLLGRRRKEQALFFDGIWSEDGQALVYAVSKPSYRPVNGKRVAIADLLVKAFESDAVPLVTASAEHPPEPGTFSVSTCRARSHPSWIRRILGLG